MALAIGMRLKKLEPEVMRLTPSQMRRQLLFFRMTDREQQKRIDELRAERGKR